MERALFYSEVACEVTGVVNPEMPRKGYYLRV
jgi:hypothetical protein